MKKFYKLYAFSISSLLLLLPLFVNASVGFQITSSESSSYCSGTNVSFTASAPVEYDSPIYQWKVNGGNVGTNSSVFQSSTLKNNDKVTCVLSNSTTVLPVLTSNALIQVVLKVPVKPNPSSFTSSQGFTNLCGKTTTISIPAVSGATYYQWIVPAGVTINSGNGTNSINVTFGSFNSLLISLSVMNQCGMGLSQSVKFFGSPGVPGPITGPVSVSANTSYTYSISAVPSAIQYIWQGPVGSTISDGFKTSTTNLLVTTSTSVQVNFASSLTTVKVAAKNPCSQSAYQVLDLTPILYYSVISSIASGPWSSASTWDCNCVPSSTQDVIINYPHYISTNSSVDAKNLSINPNATLACSTGTTINIYGDFTNYGNFVAGTSNVRFTGTSNQNINGTANTTNFYDLTTDNASSVTIINGYYSLTNALFVNAGTFKNQAGNFTLLSDANATARVAPVASGANISGNFSVQRYISPRTANWADFASPVIGATLSDWDDELYLSGVNGNDGNACCPIFYSVYTYQEATAAYNAVTSTSTPLTLGKGFELFLSNNNSNFNGGIITTTGQLAVGNQNISISRTVSSPDPGWNLIGNPFASPISWDNLIMNDLDAVYYIMDASTGTYAAYGAGTTIPAGQGFYVHTSGSNPTLTIPESAKTSSNSSNFLRTGSFSNTTSKTPVKPGNNNTALSKLNVYPNPSNGIMNITFDNYNSSECVVMIKDMTGKTVYSENRSLNSGSNTLDLSVTDLQKGLYILEIQTAEGLVNSKIAIK